MDHCRPHQNLKYIYISQFMLPVDTVMMFILNSEDYRQNVIRASHLRTHRDTYSARMHTFTHICMLAYMYTCASVRADTHPRMLTTHSESCILCERNEWLSGTNKKTHHSLLYQIHTGKSLIPMPNRIRLRTYLSV